MTRSTSSRHPFLAGFEEVERELDRRGPAWMNALRRKSSERFEAVDFPTNRLEEWKTTNVSRISAGRFRPAPRQVGLSLDGLPEAARIDLGGPRLVFVDGRHAPELSSSPDSSDGAWIGNLAAALEQLPERIEPHLTRDDPGEAPAFVALNGALAEDGAVVLVTDGAELRQPIQVVFVSTGGDPATASSPRALLVAGRGSRARVVETYVGIDGSTYLTNALTDAVLGENAELDHCRIQFEGAGAYHVSNNRSRQGRHSRYIHHNVNLGGRLVRHDVCSVLEGEGGWCQLNGLNLTDGSQHVDNHTSLDHASPHCDSRELYKGILAGDSRGVFNGRIIVRPGAQKTDAKQSNPNLLLSPGALANTRPQLEIYADDVKCTHGATIGRLDGEAIFYLRSRGVSAADARRLLLAAFAGEVLEQIRPERLRSALEQAVERRLAAALASLEATP